MSKTLVTILGKVIKTAAGLRGGGSAFPGLVVERIDRDFIKNTLSTLPMGVVVISGTNGKTTTTKMVVELLESQGLKVFTNRTGSNFTRGVAAALLGSVNIKGNLDADIAVLELDEAHAVHFVEKIPPRYSLILNVMRDQLDRFGEIDHTARLLKNVTQATSDIVVLNREDRRVANISKNLDKNKYRFFGFSNNLASLFPSDDNLHNHKLIPEKTLPVKADVTLLDIKNDIATFQFNSEKVETKLNLTGAYNIFNAAAALALVKNIMGSKLNDTKLFKSLSKVEPAFGRGETLKLNGQPLEIVLVKNPSGFRLGLKSFDPDGYATMIAINDNYADGRDMSWLWDVDFTSMEKAGVSVVSGIRAFDMALRLQYDEVKIDNVNVDINKALKIFIKNNLNKPKRIYCTYTAMLAIRRALSKKTNVEVVK